MKEPGSKVKMHVGTSPPHTHTHTTHLHPGSKLAIPCVCCVRTRPCAGAAPTCAPLATFSASSAPWSASVWARSRTQSGARSARAAPACPSTGVFYKYVCLLGARVSWACLKPLSTSLLGERAPTCLSAGVCRRLIHTSNVGGHCWAIHLYRNCDKAAHFTRVENISHTLHI